MKRICHFMIILCIFSYICANTSFKSFAVTPGITSLKVNKTYKDYDLNGDKKKDKFILKVINKGYFKNAYLYVNGKKVYSSSKLKSCEDFLLYIITLQNGRNFVNISAYNGIELATENIVLQYRNGGIKTLIDCQSIMNKYCSGVYEVDFSVSGNNLILKLNAMNWTLGGSKFYFKYEYKNGTLKRLSNFGKVKKLIYSEGEKLLAAKKFNTYKKPNSAKKSYKIKKDQKLSVVKYYLKKGQLWLCLKNSAGKLGWIRGLTYPGAVSGSPLFKNAFYFS